MFRAPRRNEIIDHSRFCENRKEFISAVIYLLVMPGKYFGHMFLKSK